MQAIKEEPRFMVRISDYGAISKNLQALEEKLRQLNISYEIANYEYWDRASRIGTAGHENETKRI